MFVFLFTVLVALHGKEPDTAYALVYAPALVVAERLLTATEGIIDHDDRPIAVFSYPDCTENKPRVILERTQKGEYHG